MELATVAEEEMDVDPKQKAASDFRRKLRYRLQNADSRRQASRILRGARLSLLYRGSVYRASLGKHANEEHDLGIPLQFVYEVLESLEMEFGDPLPLAQDRSDSCDGLHVSATLESPRREGVPPQAQLPEPLADQAYTVPRVSPEHRDGVGNNFAQQRGDRRERSVDSCAGEGVSDITTEEARGKVDGASSRAELAHEAVEHHLRDEFASSDFQPRCTPVPKAPPAPTPVGPTTLALQPSPPLPPCSLSAQRPAPEAQADAANKRRRVQTEGNVERPEPEEAPAPKLRHSRAVSGDGQSCKTEAKEEKAGAEDSRGCLQAEGATALVPASGQVCHVSERAHDHGANVESQSSSSTAHKAKTPQGKDPAVQVRHEPQHREVLVPLRSLLKRTDPAVRRQKGVNYGQLMARVHEMPIESFKQLGDDLWFRSPGSKISCDMCDKYKLNGLGEMGGRPGRPMSAQDKFICYDCEMSLSANTNPIFSPIDEVAALDMGLGLHWRSCPPGDARHDWSDNNW